MPEDLERLIWAFAAVVAAGVVFTIFIVWAFYARTAAIVKRLEQEIDRVNALRDKERADYDARLDAAHVRHEVRSEAIQEKFVRALDEIRQSHAEAMEQLAESVRSGSVQLRDYLRRQLDRKGGE